ncbi:MAG: tRNA-dihydrouridine synthase [Candidatus Moraniibacteriota bacterium]|nr:MAG: tRNA-dihydrouridine synthase [Candidatus Moranbacteria bacterium]
MAMSDEMQPFLGFWGGLKKPFFVLAPLANVTDFAFRQFVVSYKKPDVLWTEFVAADGLCHPKGQEALLRDLRFAQNERPIVAQLFTSYPEKMFEAAKLVKELGFDGLDINMGCPDKNVMKQGAGAACMKNPELAQQIIRAAMEGVRADGKGPIPVSVKTRLGFNKDEMEEWLPKVLETKPAALTLHLRTKKEMSLVPAHWDRMARAVELRDAISPETRMLGNGDVKSMPEARKKCAETGCDGVMFGRAIFGNPWLFDETKTEVMVNERLEATIQLTELFESTWKGSKNFEILKKHFQAYIVGFPKAKELRVALMETHTAQEVKAIIEKFSNENPDLLMQSIELRV